MRLRFALVYGPQKPHVMILGVLDVPDICIEGWCKQFGPVLKFQNHHFSPYLWHLEMLQLVVLRAAEERDACRVDLQQAALLEGPPPSTLLFFALCIVTPLALGMTPFQHCPVHLPDKRVWRDK